MPKMLARSRLLRRNSSRPPLRPFQAFFSMGRKMPKSYSFFAIFLGGPMGPIQPVWGNGCNISPATCISSSQARMHARPGKHWTSSRTKSRSKGSWLLETYLIPGCVGRGVRLGSESSSAVAAGVWKSGNLGIWKSGNLEVWKSGSLESDKSKKGKV